MLRRPSKARGDVHVHRHLAFEDVRRVESAFSDLDGGQLMWLHVIPFLDTRAQRVRHTPSIHRAGGETAKRLVG